MPTAWTLDASDGELHILTGVAGPAARMGHRLTILVATWSASVDWDGEQPATVRLSAEIASLAIERGDGGVTPLSGPERALARSNALKTLNAERFPSVSFQTEAVEPDNGGYLLHGQLDIHGHRREHAVHVDVEDRGDTWRMSSRTEVRHTDFGIKPYSMFMGSLKVADPVEITFTATRAKG